MTLRMVIDGIPHVLAAEHHVQALLEAATRYLRLQPTLDRHRLQRFADGIDALRVIAPAPGDETVDPRD